MAGISVTREELDDLGRKLEAADLTDKEREVLLGVFAIAGDAVANREVEGFSFGPWARPSSLAGGLSAPFENSFVQGNRSGVPGQGTNAIIIEMSAID
jgi:hypothetical protein